MRVLFEPARAVGDADKLQQLKRTGRMILPIGPEGKQRLARVTRVGTRVQIEDCGTAEFVPLVGKFGWKE